MSVTGEHLSIEELSSDAIDVMKEIRDLIEKVDLSDMSSIPTTEQETVNLYYCKPTLALFNAVKRLLKELPFIAKKVGVSCLKSHSTNRTRTQFPAITFSA
jgi:hypothetical protein